MLIKGIKTTKKPRAARNYSRLNPKYENNCKQITYATNKQSSAANEKRETKKLSTS